ncbi:hypothetical protein ASPSYDRAFT_396664 [Aspergillus sydowii CBS 593.65]|uniref:Uncharacterized protein n=1 Tax=Aspergillus sydowii CBS 593.65 TaxID=1036612 RepID=A0A1L9T998_9EURO|nr:uncharacterized protein ASPSYDRAFT_396664 [Aspergillus sydowii CBS 593.65]OJJ55996.1 hypothetical protein ASPSYDRAFT_396664 [Aspergillus sydowii CBS 593.65]
MFLFDRARNKKIHGAKQHYVMKLCSFRSFWPIVSSFLSFLTLVSDLRFPISDHIQNSDSNVEMGTRQRSVKEACDLHTSEPRRAPPS